MHSGWLQLQRHLNKYIIWLYQFFNGVQSFIIIIFYTRLRCAQIAFIFWRGMIRRIGQWTVLRSKTNAPTIVSRQTKKSEEMLKKTSSATEKNPIKTIKFIIYDDFSAHTMVGRRWYSNRRLVCSNLLFVFAIGKRELCENRLLARADKAIILIF